MLRLVSLYRCLLAALASLAAGNAPALETLTVTETRSGGLASDFPGHVTVIDREAIRTSGALHLVDVLRGQGGLSVSDLYGDGSRATLSLRGFGANAQANGLVLVDGRRLDNADLSSPDLNGIALKDIRRVEVLHGSAGSLYGDKAVGGLVNVITRDADEFDADMALQAGSYDHYGATARLSGRHDSGLGYRLSGEVRRRGNYRDHNDQDYDNLFGRLQYDYNTGRVFAEYQYTDEALQTPGALFADQLAQDRRRAATPRDFIDTTTDTLRLGLRQSLGDDWRLRAEYSFRSSEADGRLSVAGTSGGVVTEREQHEVTPRLIGVVAVPHGELQFTAGADLLQADFHLGSILGVIDNRQTRTAVYAQALYPVTPRLTLTLGGRHAKVKNRIDGALLPPDTVIEDDANAVEAGLSLRLSGSWRVYARFDSNFRFVLADEYTSASFGGVIPATQTGRSWETGAEYEGDTVSAELVVYQLDIEDEIDFDPLRFINTNIGDSRRRGLSLDASWRISERWSLGGAYHHVDAEVVSGSLDGLAIPFVAENTGTLYTRYRFTPHLRGYLEVRGMDDRVASGDFFNRGERLSGHVVSNAYLAWDWRNWTVGLRVNNVLDEHYSDNAQLGFRAPLFLPETTYYPAPGRNFLLSLKYHID